MTQSSEFNFADLDELTERMIRRAIPKGQGLPSLQVPFDSREMAMLCDWGTDGTEASAILTRTALNMPTKRVLRREARADQVQEAAE